MKLAFLAPAFVVACGLAALVRGAEPATATAPTLKSGRFANDIKSFAKRDRKDSYPRDAVLFVGSSSVRHWQTAEAFPDLPVINRGFGGSQVSDVNHYFDDVVSKYRPKVIVFYSGDNDTQAGKSPERIYRDVADFVGRVHESLPQTRIIFLPIKPSISRWSKWPQMQQTNALVAGLAQRDERLEIVDTATPLLGADGQPRREFYIADGLHLSAKGYAIWNEILTPILEQALASP